MEHLDALAKILAVTGSFLIGMRWVVKRIESGQEKLRKGQQKLRKEKIRLLRTFIRRLQTVQTRQTPSLRVFPASMILLNTATM